MVKRFCPKCGREADSFIKNFCKHCFLQDRQDLVVVPAKLEVEFCSRCDKVRLKGKWVPLSDENLAEFIKSKTKVKDLRNEKIAVELSDFDFNKMVAKVVVLGEIDSHILKIEKEAIVDLRSGICDACMKVSSNYHEAIVQIRKGKGSGEEDLEGALNDFRYELSLIEPKDSLAKIVSVSKVRNGVDVLVGSKRGAKIAVEKVAKQFDWKVVVSSKLIGVDRSGKQKYRFTFLLRV